MALRCSVPTIRRGVSVLVLALAAAPAYAGSNGPGIGIKGGAQTLTNPWTDTKTTRARLEIELCTPKLLDDHFDVAATFGFSSLGSRSSGSTSIEDGLIVDRWSEDDLSLYDLRLAVRFFPVGHERTVVSPYVGAGLGYFLFIDKWEDTVTATDPESFASATDVTGQTETVAEGLFPFVVAGLNVPLGDNAELLFEVEYDIEKENNGFDLGGPIYMAGCRLRF
jgi:hypothetical protein